MIPDVINIFILPPSFSALEERLYERGDEESAIADRMKEAIHEIRHYREYDYLVINDDFNRAVDQLVAIFHTAGLNYRLQSRYFDDFVNELLLQGGDFK